jgi:flagellar hook-associated protein 1 FlgK
MASTFSALAAASNTLKAYESALNITQNNIGNSSTPNYSAQQAQFDSLAFQPNTGLEGGVGGVTALDTRSAYADQSVRNEISNLGTAQQESTLLTNLQGNFDVTGQTGIAAGLSGLFASFSALSANPTNPSSQQAVIDSATQVAKNFQQTATALSQAGTSATQQIQSQVSEINALAGQIQQYNAAQQASSRPDPSLAARTETALERLSQLANVSVSKAQDGTTSVLIDGQTPLVLGSQQYQISAQAVVTSAAQPPANPQGTPDIQILDSNGNDITFQFTQGQLAGSLKVRNTVIPGLIGNTAQTGNINQLAKTFADRVNTLLTAGNISSGPPAVPGVPLFTYDTTNPTDIAQSLAVSSTITPSQIAIISPGPPIVSNGIANQIAALAQGTNATDQISGVSYGAYFGQLAASIGAQVTAASSNSSLYTQSVAQAQNLQTQLSGVSLDTEATNLIDFQRGYDATAKLVTALDQITQSTINILQ